MKILLKWILIIILAFLFGGILIGLALSVQGGVSPKGMLSIMVSSWLAFWIGSGFYLKKQGKKQPYAIGFMIGMSAALVISYGITYLFPSEEEMTIKAIEAEQQYFLLSVGSLDHSRICLAAEKALNSYRKINNNEKINLFKYIIIRDKCL